ncbi:MAG: type II toxin-antitoxin system RelE/ParE family toxin [Acidobacteriota bacterium]
MRRVRIPAGIAELVRGLHPELKRKVRSALDEILRHPDGGKALKQDLAGLRSWRLGRIRIIYREQGTDVVDVVAIGPRRTIYEETIRLIRRAGHQ